MFLEPEINLSEPTVPLILPVDQDVINLMLFDNRLSSAKALIESDSVNVKEG